MHLIQLIQLMAVSILSIDNFTIENPKTEREKY
jgi:hypothetical protein